MGGRWGQASGRGGGVESGGEESRIRAREEGNREGKSRWEVGSHALRG